MNSNSVNPNQALWEKGDFTEIAAFMRQSGEAVIQAIGIAPPLRVLDLGCGDGTTAIPLARLGAEVVGIDIARNLVEAGNRRAAEAGLTRLKFREGDACNLEDVADGSLDLVVSMFGAMFAPKPFDVAKEMVRVTRPGGRIGHGQLDSERSDVRNASAENQLCVYASAAGRLYQSHDVGCGEQHHRSFWPCGSA